MRQNQISEKSDFPMVQIAISIEVLGVVRVLHFFIIPHVQTQSNGAAISMYFIVIYASEGSHFLQIFILNICF
jgi:hypothetical protein